VPVHPDIASRFPLLDGLTSMREAYSTPAGRAQILRYETWGQEPPEVPSRDDAAPGPHGPVPVRIYTPESPTGAGLVWAHGGGFVGGDLDMREADWTAREVAARAGAVVVSVDYRLAVDGVHYPVPHDDVVAAVAWTRDNPAALGIDPGRISIGGASAGGNLAAGAALKLRDRDGWQPSALVFVYGVAHAVVPPPSPGLAAALTELPPLLAPAPGSRDDFLTVNYLGGPLSTADGYAMPALAVLDGLCPTVVINAEYDDLRASGEAFTAALAVAGVDVRQVTVPGVLHGFLNQPAELEPVGRCLDLMARVVAEAGHDRVPSLEGVRP
jgi:acetyl esterase/lipase